MYIRPSPPIDIVETWAIGSIIDARETQPDNSFRINSSSGRLEIASSPQTVEYTYMRALINNSFFCIFLIMDENVQNWTLPLEGPRSRRFRIT